MALEKHVVELSARDNLSATFKKVGTEAELAGRKGEEGAKRATRAQADWGRAASTLGLGLGALTGAAIRLGNESEVVQQRLEQSIENTGAAYDDLEEAIGRAADRSLDLAFDDEDALNALSELTDVTGDAEKAIRDLAIAQDVARGRGISLAAATDLVVAAESGRTQSLRRVGIVLDENASKEDYLAALQSKYAGQAEAYAETNQAAWERFGNTVENKLEGLGGALADFQGPLIALGGASMAIGPLGDAFEALNGKAKLAAAGSKALSLALGPVGLAAAIGIAGVALYKLRQGWDASILTADEATSSVNDFTEAIARLASGGASRDISQIAVELVGPYTLLGQEINKARQEQVELQRQLEAGVAPGDLVGMTIEELNEGEKALEARIAWLDQLILSETEYQQVQSQTIALLSHQGLNAEVVTDRVESLFSQYENGQITADQLAAGIQYLTDNMNTYGLTLEEIASQSKATTAETATLIAQLDLLSDRMYLTGGGTSVANDSLVEYGNSLSALPETYAENIDRLAAVNAEMSAFGELTVESTAQVDQYTAMLSAAVVETAAMDAAIGDLAVNLQREFAGAASQAHGMVVGFTEGMVNSIGTSKEWIDEFAGAAGVWSTLDDLITAGRIDLEDYNEVLESQGRITNASARATDAMNVIWAKQSDVVAEGAEATADYIESISGMNEAEQLLALAWADQDMAGRATQIANMAAEWDNMSTAQQLAFEEVAVSAAATDPVLAKMLEQMGLISIGADGTITIRDDGLGGAADAMERLVTAFDHFIVATEVMYEIDINQDGVIGLNEHLGEANRQMDTLDDQYATMDVDSGQVDTANTGLQTAITKVGELMGASATVNITADTTAFHGSLSGLTGDVGDAYIDVWFNQRNNPDGSGAFALGGMVGADIPHAALGRMMGGSMALVGEAGPELVHLPIGSNVHPNHASRYMGGGGGGITINGPITVVASNPQQFIQQMRSYTEPMARR